MTREQEIYRCRVCDFTSERYGTMIGPDDPGPDYGTSGIDRHVRAKHRASYEQHLRRFQAQLWSTEMILEG